MTPWTFPLRPLPSVLRLLPPLRGKAGMGGPGRHSSEACPREGGARESIPHSVRDAGRPEPLTPTLSLKGRGSRT